MRTFILVECVLLALLCVLSILDHVSLVSGEAPLVAVVDKRDTKPHIDGDQYVNATLGKRVAMRCNVHSVKNYKIAWYFNGVLLALNTMRIRDDKRFSIENPSTHEWILVIDPVELTNQGQYSCRLTNGMKRLIFLSVGVAPTFLDKTVSHQVVINAVEHQDVTLSCQARGNPTPVIFWYKNDKLVGNGPNFTVREISRHSHLEYECVARNAVEPDPSRHFRINVNFKPAISLTFSYKEHPTIRFNIHQTLSRDRAHDTESIGHLNEGDMQFACEIHGNPITSIHWYKNGMRLKENFRRKVSNRNSNDSTPPSVVPSTLSTVAADLTKARRVKSVSVHTARIGPYKMLSKLKIQNFDEYDHGVYKCSVNGYDGETSKSIHMTDAENRVASTETDLLISSGSSSSLNSSSEWRAEDSSAHNSNLLGDNESYSIHAVAKLPENGYLTHGRGARSNLTRNELTSSAQTTQRSVFFVVAIGVQLLASSLISFT